MKNLLFVCLLFLCSFGFSQKKNARDTSKVILQPQRIEFIRESGSSEFTLLHAEENGIMLIEDTRKRFNSEGYKWHVNLVDTGLNITWKQTLSLPFEYRLLGYETYNDEFYLLFKTERFETDDLAVIHFEHSDDSTLVYNSYQITTVFPVELTHFEVIDNKIILAGMANYRSVVITYDLDDQIPRVLPGFYNNKSDILDIVIDDDNKLYTILTQEKQRKKQYTVRFRTYTIKNDLVLNTIIEPEDRRSIIDASITNFSGGLQYLAGSQSKKSIQFSNGFYLSKFVNGQQKIDKYYPFADLGNFFAHLKPKRENRIKNQIERKRQRGKIKKFNYRLLVHEIMEYDNEYIMVAEAYYPKYSYYTDPLSFTSQGNDRIFLGYVWTHAVVVGFDKNCNILWDNTFRIDGRQSYALEKMVHVSKIEDNVILNYVEENEVRSKVIQDNQVVERRSYSPIKLSFNTDKVNDNDNYYEGFDQWYGNTAIAYGEQAIRNDNLSGQNVRKVFYINKIQYGFEDLETE